MDKRRQTNPTVLALETMQMLDPKMPDAARLKELRATLEAMKKEIEYHLGSVQYVERLHEIKKQISN